VRTVACCRQRQRRPKATHVQRFLLTHAHARWEIEARLQANVQTEAARNAVPCLREVVSQLASSIDPPPPSFVSAGAKDNQLALVQEWEVAMTEMRGAASSDTALAAAQERAAPFVQAMLRAAKVVIEPNLGRLEAHLDEMLDRSVSDAEASTLRPPPRPST
jgi:hypothetical protein